MLRRISSALFLLVLISSLAFSAASQSNEKKISVKEKFGGNWRGTFNGDTAGKLEINLSPSDDGKHTGNISVLTDAGDKYQADFKLITLEGDKFKVKYNDPNGSEVSLEGTSDGKTLQGKWVYQSGDNVVANGELKLTKDAK